jgi:hypothetical protein
VKFDRVYAHLKPFERRELIRLMLHRAVLGDHEMVLEINGRACREFVQAPQNTQSGTWFAERAIWLPEVDSNHRHRSAGVGVVAQRTYVGSRIDAD